MGKIETLELRSYIKELLSDHTAVIVSELGHQKDEIKKLNNTIDTHNGRLTKMESAILLFQGAKIAIKGVWGLLGVFLIAIVFGLFTMYIEFQSFKSQIRELDDNIAKEVTAQISTLEFNITE